MLSRDEAAKHGLMFSIEGETRREDPDQELFQADLTLDGHTHVFAGKSEEDILAQAERVLILAGKIEKDSDGAAESEPTVGQESDVADLEAFRGQRDETAEELSKQLEERGDAA